MTRVRIVVTVAVLLLVVPAASAQETNPDPCTRYACAWDSSDMPYCRYSAGRMGEWVECRTVQKCMPTYIPPVGWHMNCWYDCEGEYCLEV